MSTHHVVVRISNYSIEDSLDLEGIAKSKIQRLGLYPFAIISTLYGAAHLICWNSFFSSEIEQWMWRSISIAIAGAAPLYIVINVYAGRQANPNASWHTCTGVLKKINEIFREIFQMIMVAIIAIGYPYGRFFILGEVFANLRELPAKAYQTVEWTNFIPHAG